MFNNVFKVLINPLHEVIHDKEEKKKFIFTGFRSRTTVCFSSTTVLDQTGPRVSKTRDRAPDRARLCDFLKKSIRPARACVHDARPCAGTTRVMHYHINRAA